MHYLESPCGLLKVVCMTKRAIASGPLVPFTLPSTHANAQMTIPLLSSPCPRQRDDPNTAQLWQELTRTPPNTRRSRFRHRQGIYIYIFLNGILLSTFY